MPQISLPTKWGRKRYQAITTSHFPATGLWNKWGYLHCSVLLSGYTSRVHFGISCNKIKTNSTLWGVQQNALVLTLVALSTARQWFAGTGVAEFPPLHTPLCLSFHNHLWSPSVWISSLLPNFFLSFCTGAFWCWLPDVQRNRTWQSEVRQDPITGTSPHPAPISQWG